MHHAEISYRHQIRLNRAINFVHRFCAETLSLEQLAEVACLSKYHFARIFTEYLGESPIAFSSRIKLERAAFMLAFCRDRPIFDIASRCGFASNQTLARAFKNRFEYSPRDFRANHVFRVGTNETLSELERALTSLRSRVPAENSNITESSKIRVVQQPDLCVAYIRNFGKYGSQGSIPAIHQTIKKWAKDHSLWRSNTRIIGASWDSPRITPEQLCRYDACISIPEYTPLPDDIPIQIIPGGLYAVIRVDPLVDEIPLFWESFLLLLKDWPRFKQFNLRFGPYYEVLDIDESSDSSTLDLYAPVSFS